MANTESEQMVGLGKASGSLFNQLRERIQSGVHQSGAFLPSVRELCRSQGLSSETVCRALRRLEAEGLVAAEPRKGYRVLARANDPDRGCPIAYILSAEQPGATWQDQYRLLFSSLQHCAAGRGWSMLGAGTAGMSPAEALEQCRNSNAWGVIVDVHNADVVRLARRAGLTVIVIDAWQPGMEADVVMQDNFSGGFQAGLHLGARGHKRVAWIGPTTESVHAMNRFGGARGGLARHGVSLKDGMIFDVFQKDARKTALKLLSRRDRPTGILTLWRQATLAVCDAARELGLKLGNDIDVVGWCPAEQYDDGFLPHFNGGPVPAVVSWSLKTMAEVTIDRLADRRTRPNLPLMRLNIETWLRTPHQTPRSAKRQ